MATGYVLGVFAIIIAVIIHVVTGSNALGVMTAAALVEFCAGEGWDRLYSGLYPVSENEVGTGVYGSLWAARLPGLVWCLWKAGDLRKNLICDKVWMADFDILIMLCESFPL